MFGGYETAERQMAAFVPDAFCYEEDFHVESAYPISCIRVAPLQAKFADALTHRDYLGSILNLGLDRSKIGDILLEEDCAYVFCHSSVCGFLIEEISRIKHTSVMAKEILQKKICQNPDGRKFLALLHPQGLTVSLPWLFIPLEVVWFHLLKAERYL